MELTSIAKFYSTNRVWGLKSQPTITNQPTKAVNLQRRVAILSNHYSGDITRNSLFLCV